MPSPRLDQEGLMLINSAAPPIVPSIINSIINQSLLRITIKEGPENNCQTLVTNEGITSKAAAAGNGIKVLSKPIATVGKPIPVIPLTKPAAIKIEIKKR